jgi:hypothetical protein
VAAIVLASFLVPISSAQAQQNDGPIKPAVADSIRDTLQRPPAKPPFDAVDAVALPFKIIILPLRLLGLGFAELAGFVVKPDPKPIPIVETLKAAGVRGGFGTIGPRSGVSVRLGYEGLRPFFVEGAFSIRLSQRYRAGFLWQGSNGRTLEAAATFWRNAQPYFYGIGLDTREDERVNFLWDQWTISLTGSARRPVDRAATLVVSGKLAWEDNSIGRGKSKKVPTIQDDPRSSQLYGVNERVKYVRVGGSVGLDLTYTRGLQPRGLYIEAGYEYFGGIDETDSDFGRASANLFGYMPLNPRQQLAFRLTMESNTSLGGEGVPFYYLATVGSEQGGRAYHQLRFRDQAMAAFMLEWRWEIWRELHERSRVEAFVFYDSGSIAPRVFEIQLKGMRRSIGFGWSLSTLQGGALVNYIAFGNEGFRLRVSFGTAF